jgi:hypothetical protein
MPRLFWIRVVGGSLMTILSALLTASDVQQIIGLDAKWFVGIFFVISLVLLLSVIFDLRHKLQEILASKPNIVFHHIDEHFTGNIETHMYSNMFKQRIITQAETTYYTRIWVSNEPTRVELGIKAEGIAGQIDVWDESYQKLIFSMSGRWAETKQAIQGALPLETKQIDMPPNASPYCMDIGIKFTDEDEFYCYNDETQYKRAPGGRDPERKLGIGSYLVMVRFRCKGVDTPFWFQLVNLGKGYQVSFTTTNSPLALSKEDSLKK